MKVDKCHLANSVVQILSFNGYIHTEAVGILYQFKAQINKTDIKVYIVIFFVESPYMSTYHAIAELVSWISLCVLNKQMKN